MQPRSSAINFLMQNLPTPTGTPTAAQKTNCLTASVIDMNYVAAKILARVTKRYATLTHAVNAATTVTYSCYAASATKQLTEPQPSIEQPLRCVKSNRTNQSAGPSHRRHHGFRFPVTPSQLGTSSDDDEEESFEEEDPNDHPQPTLRFNHRRRNYSSDDDTDDSSENGNAEEEHRPRAAEGQHSPTDANGDSTDNREATTSSADCSCQDSNHDHSDEAELESESDNDGASDKESGCSIDSKCSIDPRVRWLHRLDSVQPGQHVRYTGYGSPLTREDYIAWTLDPNAGHLPTKDYRSIGKRLAVSIGSAPMSITSDAESEQSDDDQHPKSTSKPPSPDTTDDRPARWEVDLSRSTDNYCSSDDTIEYVLSDQQKEEIHIYWPQSQANAEPSLYCNDPMLSDTSYGESSESSGIGTSIDSPFGDLDPYQPPQRPTIPELKKTTKRWPRSPPSVMGSTETITVYHQHLSTPEPKSKEEPVNPWEQEASDGGEATTNAQPVSPVNTAGPSDSNSSNQPPNSYDEEWDDMEEYLRESHFYEPTRGSSASPIADNYKNGNEGEQDSIESIPRSSLGAAEIFDLRFAAENRSELPQSPRQSPLSQASPAPLPTHDEDGEHDVAALEHYPTAQEILETTWSAVCPENGGTIEQRQEWYEWKFSGDYLRHARETVPGTPPSSPSPSAVSAASALVRPKSDIKTEKALKLNDRTDDPKTDAPDDDVDDRGKQPKKARCHDDPSTTRQCSVARAWQPAPTWLATEPAIQTVDTRETETPSAPNLVEQCRIASLAQIGCEEIIRRRTPGFERPVQILTIQERVDIEFQRLLDRLHQRQQQRLQELEKTDPTPSISSTHHASSASPSDEQQQQQKKKKRG